MEDFLPLLEGWGNYESCIIKKGPFDSSAALKFKIHFPTLSTLAHQILLRCFNNKISNSAVEPEGLEKTIFTVWENQKLNNRRWYIAQFLWWWVSNYRKLARCELQRMRDKMYFNQKIIVINNRFGATRFLHKQRVLIFHVVEPNILFMWIQMDVKCYEVVNASLWVDKVELWARIVVHPLFENKINVETMWCRAW